ncbi:MAG: BNR-4 repeat-containing protein, partial [Planctomycetaceae bacterium]|nr:BNR-4 repeat-containing protein [Planctomycetaceae bacterium]
ATAFNYHPRAGGLNARTNLYYLESRDGGASWQNAAGEPVATPLIEVRNPALVHDYEAERLLVYLKQVQFDSAGNPLILYLTSGGHEPGPRNDPRAWRIARWNGQQWTHQDVVTSDHNYDYGSLYLEAEQTWRLIAPTEPGPQPYCTGGEMAMWLSRDQGESWKQVRQLTRDSRLNHTYARQPVGARDDFYALWADGDAHRPSGSNLYFTDRAGSHVWRLPRAMSAAAQPAEVAW